MSSSMPWVKIYTEMLDDPKLGELSEETKWRFVQLILLAGEYDADGYIVTRDTSVTHAHIAWRLRVTLEKVTQDIEILCAHGLIAIEDGAVFIPKFAERQGRKQSEKQAQWRARQAKARKKNVTRDSRVSHPSRVEKSREEENREEKSKNGASAPSLSLESSVSHSDPQPGTINARTETPATVNFEAEHKAPEATLESVKPIQHRAPRPLFDAIAEVTASNVKLMGGRIAKVASELSKVDATPDQVRQVAAWYSRNDWRGKKGEKLTFATLIQVWDQGIRGVSPATSSNGNGTHESPSDIAIQNLINKYEKQGLQET